MASHNPLFNIAFRVKPEEVRRKKLKIDIFSKIFMALEMCLGVNRLYLTGFKSKLCVLIMLCYTLLFYLTVFYKVTVHFRFQILFILEYPDFIQCVVCTTLSYAFQKKLINFYTELSKFDEEIRFMPKVSFYNIYNLLQLVVTLVVCCVVYGIGPWAGAGPALFMYLLHLYVMKLLHVVEIHYYGHLISLLIPRLKFLAEYLKLSYCNEQAREDPEAIVTDVDLNNLPRDDANFTYVLLEKAMDLYNKITEIYDVLYEAIKWQMLALIAASFTVTLVVIYHVIITDATAAGKGVHYVNITFFMLEVTPILVPCIFAHRVAKEASHLKELVNSRLYEKARGELDKSCRRTGRALLALMEHRNLSFSLFHMFDVDIGLPVKFIALLVTYVLVMLQFNKYIRPIGTL